MSVTSIERPLAVSDAEWEVRCHLAALYRVLHHLRMTDLIYTHMSVRVPGEPDRFLINRYGELFDEVTASSLVKMDMDGNVVGEPGSFNLAGFKIHSGVYLAAPGVNCVMHTHTRAGVAVSAQAHGLLPVTQHAMAIWPELGYHDYGGPGSIEPREAVGEGCGKSPCVIMRNHGLLTTGATIPAAFYRMYYLELACQIQTAAMAGGSKLTPLTEEVMAATVARETERLGEPDLGELEWQSLLRMLERQGVDYRH